MLNINPKEMLCAFSSWSWETPGTPLNSFSSGKAGHLFIKRTLTFLFIFLVNAKKKNICNSNNEKNLTNTFEATERNR